MAEENFFVMGSEREGRDRPSTLEPMEPVVTGPDGLVHAIDARTGRPACGTKKRLVRFDDRPWEYGFGISLCEQCEALQPPS